MGEAEGFAAYRTIMAAARRGTISPEAAIRWARWAAGGQDVSVLDQMTGPPWEDRRQWMAAAANSDLAQRVLDILLQLTGGVLPGAQAGDEFARLFPPHAPLGPPQGAEEYPSQSLIYPGEDQGKRTRRVTTWDGYLQAGAPPGPDEMSDEEADALLPPRTAEESERRARRVEARAAYVEDLSDDELYRLLFGDTPG